jgi:hypothetical protein
VSFGTNLKNMIKNIVYNIKFITPGVCIKNVFTSFKLSRNMTQMTTIMMAINNIKNTSVVISLFVEDDVGLELGSFT